jgi:hypothetical protein
MQFAIVNGNSIVSLGTPLELFPNTSFPIEPIDMEFLDQQSAMIVKDYKPYTDSQKLETVVPYIENGFVYTVRVFDKTSDELTAEAETMYLSVSSNVREQRNRMLTASDWTQVEDTSADKAVWAIYRKALRDITTQEGFPFNVTWPDIPTT